MAPADAAAPLCPRAASTPAIDVVATVINAPSINADGSPNIYEYPAPTLDMVFSQKITKRLVFKAFVKNLLNSTTYYRYTNAGNTKTFGVDNQEYIRRAFNYGSVFTLGFKYTL